MMTLPRTCLTVLAASLLALAPSARAVDGVIEINQAAALTGGVTASDAAGFPVTLDSPGSYRLTGNLVVPDQNTDAIVVNADNVTIDLGGFSIMGTASCSGSTGAISCSGAGPGNGIHATMRGLPVPRRSDGTVVRNGTISGMGNYGIEVRDGAWIDGVHIEHCGSTAIRAEDDSLVTDSRIRLVGGAGLIAVSGVVNFRGNRIARVGGASHIGATEIGGNTCDDARCSAVPKRHFYLTQTAVQGDGILAACDDGYHAATLHEIADPSALTYDWPRGLNQLDAGQGPPANSSAWVRSGRDLSSVSGVGEANCALWTSSSSLNQGSVALLTKAWDEPGEKLNPWDGFAASCSFSLGVWCVQD